MPPTEKSPNLTIRDAGPMDRPQLRRAIVELQEYERRLHDTRLPGEQVADAYLAWVENQIGEDGALLVAEIDRSFVGFVAGWIECSDFIAETPDSGRFGYISDVLQQIQSSFGALPFKSGPGRLAFINLGRFLSAK